MSCQCGSTSSKIMIPPDEYFGLKTVFQAFKGSIKKKSDVVILLVHWYLTFKNKFQFAGVGDPLEPPPGNDILNDNWNESQVNYLMHYNIRDLRYTLASCISEDSLIINLINFEKDLISQLVLEVKYAVKNKQEFYDVLEILENPDTLIYRIGKELVFPIYKIPIEDRTTQVQAEEVASLRLKYQLLKDKRRVGGPSSCKNILRLLNAQCCVPHPNQDQKPIYKRCKSQSISIDWNHRGGVKTLGGGRIDGSISALLPKNQEKLHHFHFLMYS